MGGSSSLSRAASTPASAQLSAALASSRLIMVSSPAGLSTAPIMSSARWSVQSPPVVNAAILGPLPYVPAVNWPSQAPCVTGQVDYSQSMSVTRCRPIHFA